MAGASGQTAIFDNLSAITRDVYMPGLVDNIYDSNPLLKRLRAKADFVNGGEFLREQVLYAKNTSKGSYSGYDILNTAPTEKRASAVFAWAHYYVNISIARTDLLKNNGEAAVVRYLESELKSAELDMSDQLGTGIYDNGADADGLVGLREVTGIDRTYGGIDSTTYTWWDSQVDSDTHTRANMADSTNASFILDQFRDMWGVCTIGRDHPTIILTTQAVWDILWSQTADNGRYNFESGAELGNIGYQVLQFNGIPVVVDSHCPNGFTFFLNENYLSLKVHPEDDFYFEPFQKPVNQSVHIAKVFWSGQLMCNNPRMQGVFSSLGAS